MPIVTARVSCQRPNGFRLQQVAGLFDLTLHDTCEETFEVEVPGIDDDWTIGAIVGPSGSGKSTIARQAFGPAVIAQREWPDDQAVVDAVGGESIRTITQTLTAVGFSSPPAWIKPYRVLSGGERFRCDLARALLSPQPLVVCDEFTSVVDRTVAKVGSAAVSKAIRSGRIAKRFVAVTCHYDVLEWLEPDWVVDMASCQLRRECLRRPQLTFEVVRCRLATWRLFARHHYLSHQLPCAATCYLALLGDEPVAFCATSGMFGYKGRKRVTRIVTLPDYQGIGIGARLLDRVCQAEREAGFRINITTSHPAMIAYCRRAPQWRAVGVKKLGFTSGGRRCQARVKTSAGRSVVSFEYLGAAARAA